MRDLERVRAEVEELEYFFLNILLRLCGLWTAGLACVGNIPLCFTICPFRHVHITLNLKRVF